jgi:hypothetical protein
MKITTLTEALTHFHCLPQFTCHIFFRSAPILILPATWLQSLIVFNSAYFALTSPLLSLFLFLAQAAA